MEIKKKIVYRLKRLYREYYLPVKLRNKTKVFCIGANKTGTTSLAKAFDVLGFEVGDQHKAESLSINCLYQNYKPLIDYCKTAEVFQDVPFSFLEVYKVLDKNFPKSKFILSIRDSSEQWYQSIIKFHSKIFGNEIMNSWEEIKKLNYVTPEWVYNIRQGVYGLTDLDHPYEKTKLIEYYEKRNNEIVDYFKNRPDDLLVINLSEKGSYQKLIDFLGITSPFNDFPWENKTSEINIK